MIRDSMKLGPVGGIFNLALVLQDSIFENQDAAKFAKSMAPKAIATKFLDEESRHLCTDLHVFVAFSSVSCGRGNAGQANYGMTNSVMERIMEQRCMLGLPAKAIQWGVIGDVGVVSEMNDDYQVSGVAKQRISSCIEVLDALLLSQDPVVSSMILAEKEHNSKGSKTITDVTMQILGLKDLSNISLEATLTEMGIDSLMTVELKQILECDYEISLTTQEVRALTFLKIMDYAKALGNSKEPIHQKTHDNDKLRLVVNLTACLVEEKYDDDTILILENGSLAEDSNCGVLIIPGIEGVASPKWMKLAMGLKVPLALLQYKNTSYATTLDECMKIIEEVK